MDQLQTLDQIRSGAETSGNYRPRLATRSEHTMSTFLKPIEMHPHTSVTLHGGERSRDRTRSETALSDSQQGVGEDVEDLFRETEGQNFQQPFTGWEQQSQDPILPTQTSAKPGSREETVISSTNQLQKEDEFLLEFYQDKDGYIKRPMNAFMVWSKIWRCTLLEQNPGARNTDISIHLGHEWSKLTEEEKGPYFEIAWKLKQIHQQKFPDYEYRPLKKKSKQLFPPSGRGQQGTTLPASRPIPPQFEFESPSMNAWPAMMPYTAGYCFYPSFYQYIPSMNSARVFNRFPHICNTMRTEANYHSHPQILESNLACLIYQPTTKQQEQCMDNHHEYMAGSTPADICTSQQLSANDIVDCDDYLDVVGLP